ncbi:MAG: phosphatidate cytidylyltransferase [bacterium]
MHINSIFVHLQHLRGQVTIDPFFKGPDLETQEKKSSNLLLRIAIGIPTGGIVSCIFAYGNISLLIVCMLLTWIGLREFWDLTGLTGRGKNPYLSWFADLAGMIMLYSAWANYTGSLDILLALFLPIIFITQLVMLIRGEKGFLRDIAIAILGVLYIAGFMSFILRLRNLQLDMLDSGSLEFASTFFKSPHMIYLTLFPVLAGWGSDTSAMFSGKFFGKGKLAPSISPKKTRIGLVGAMVGSATCVVAFSYLIGLVGRIPLWELIVYGLTIGAISQLGDLTMSAIKREAGRKDSGNILGPHGGMLDRIDGFLFTLPITYLFFVLVL